MLAEYELNRERNENILVCNGDAVCPYHFHRKVELLYVVRGAKRIFASGKEITLGEDNIFIADSYALHSYLDSPGSEQIVIVFPHRMLQNYYSYFGGDVLSDNTITDREFARTLKPHFEALAGKSLNPLLYQAHCDMLLGEIVEKVGVREEGLRDRQSFVEDILKYIERHYAEEITLESMAEHFGYSKYYFSHIFNKVLGTSITDYVSTIRLIKALDMLKRRDCTVSEAALECGFSSIPTFYRALKKNYKYKKISDLL